MAVNNAEVWKNHIGVTWSVILNKDKYQPVSRYLLLAARIEWKV